MAAGEEKLTDEKKRIYHLLHVLWGKATEGPNYDKQEWKDFSILVEKARG